MYVFVSISILGNRVSSGPSDPRWPQYPIPIPQLHSPYQTFQFSRKKAAYL